MRLYTELGSAWKLALAISPLFPQDSQAAAVSLKPSADSLSSQIRLHDGWRFRRFEDTPDGMIYDLRDNAADDLTVLKDWILPTSNSFIKDKKDQYDRPTEQPDVDIEYVKKSYDDGDWDQVTVPHDWAIKLPFLENDDIVPSSMGQLPVYGVGYYRRTLEISQDDLEKTIYLDIDGAMSHPMIWVNEKLVGGWAYGYSSFRLEITKYLSKGENNSLVVRVDNPRGSWERWYPGAGLYRNVWLNKVHPTHVGHWGTIITTKDISTEAATIDLSVFIENTGDKDSDVTVSTEVYELELGSSERKRRVAKFPQETATVASDEKTRVNSSVVIKDPKLWGPPPSQSPNLYVAVTQLSKGKSLLHSYETIFGIRSLEYTGSKGLLVNGEHVRLQGVNQHHDLGALGSAFNERAAERQLEILQEMGVNGIRMSHNPPAPELLALTDRMGFLVIDEIFDSWRQKKTDYDYHLLFDDWHEADLRTLIRRDRNHPSVFAWSYGNEVSEQEEEPIASDTSNALRAILEEEDPTRLGTFSMNRASPQSPLAHTAGIISLNYQGEGIRWGPAYDHLTSGTKRPPQYDAFHEEFPDTLLMGSEIAWSLSLRGSFVFPVTPYSSAPLNDTTGGDPETHAVSAYELYTSEAGSSPDKVFQTQDERSFVAGGFVWSGWDYLGEPYWCETCRSGYNGIIDLAGFKKERFWLYQSFWRPDHPMAHIVPHWNWPDRRGKVTPVHVFSSGDEAELFINGKSQGRLQKEDLEYRFRWDNVTFEPGEVRVETYKDGKEWAGDVVHTTGKAAALRLTADRSRITADGEDLSFVTVEVVDDNGLVVPDADNEIQFSVSGRGELKATDNGFPDDFTPFQSKKRKAFNGLCLGIVSATPGKHGSIRVKAQSDGLGSNEIVLVSH